MTHSITYPTKIPNIINSKIAPNKYDFVAILPNNCVPHFIHFCENQIIFSEIADSNAKSLNKIVVASHDTTTIHNEGLYALLFNNGEVMTGGFLPTIPQNLLPLPERVNMTGASVRCVGNDGNERSEFFNTEFGWVKMGIFVSSATLEELQSLIGQATYKPAFYLFMDVAQNVGTLVPISLNESGGSSKGKSPNISPQKITPKQNEREKIFRIQALVAADCYKLFDDTTGKDCGLAHIPDFKTSKKMNSLFRTIKENYNLDMMEESDDEDEFENCRDDKYVDTEKTVRMMCQFHPKFKKWVPVEEILR